MASSGTTTYTITAGNFINSALKSMRVLQEGQTPSAEMQADALIHLNLLVKSFAINGCKLWTTYQVQVPCVASQQVYTIGPSGADVTALRPVSIVEMGNYFRQTIGSSTNDTPLRVISRAEYMQFGAKGSTGIPNSIYYNPSIELTTPGAPTGAAGHGTLYVYVTLAPNATGTIFLNAQRHIFDITATTEEIDIPLEFLNGFRYCFYASFGEDCEVPEDRLTRWIKMANAFKDEFFDSQVETASVSFGIDSTGRR